MEKDNNVSKVFDNGVNWTKKTVDFLDKGLNKIIAQIPFLDAKKSAKQRVIAALVLIPVALYIIFAAKALLILLVMIVAVLGICAALFPEVYKGSAQELGKEAQELKDAHHDKDSHPSKKK